MTARITENTLLYYFLPKCLNWGHHVTNLDLQLKSHIITRLLTGCKQTHSLLYPGSHYGYTNPIAYPISANLLPAR